MTRFTTIIDGVDQICLDEHGDDRGDLVAIEEGNGNSISDEPSLLYL